MNKLAVNFQSLYLEDDIETLKMAALYFDEINLVDINCVITLPFGFLTPSARQGETSLKYRSLTTAPSEICALLDQMISTGLLKCKRSKSWDDYWHIDHSPTKTNSKKLYIAVDGGPDEVKNPFRVIQEFSHLFGNFFVKDLVGRNDLPSPFDINDVIGNDNTTKALMNDLDAAKELRWMVGEGSPICKVKDFPGIQDNGENYIHVNEIYAFLALTAIYAMNDFKTPFCTDSYILNQFLTHLFASGLANVVDSRALKVLREKSKEPFLALEIMKTYLPALNFRSIDDILEARTRLKDDLLYFRDAVGAISDDVGTRTWDEGFKEDIKLTIKTKVDPAIRDLRRNIKTTHDKTLLKLIKGIKSPWAYLPFVATLFTDIPNALALAASLGLVGFETLLETHFEKKKHLHSNGLSFLLWRG